jgi:hypothetical protein
MSNGNDVNNLAHSFVAMAQAFEQLPIVKAELEGATQNNHELREIIQRLELRIIELKNEAEIAHEATRKMEVERDHAETMFLETDSNLDQAKSVLKALTRRAGEFLHVVEPPKPEPEPVVEPEPQGERAVDPIPVPTPEITGTTTAADATVASEDQRDATPTAPSWASPTSPPSTAPDASAVSGESDVSSTTGESAAGEPDTTSSASTEGGQSHSNQSPDTNQSTEGVSVPSDPTQATESSSESVYSASIEKPVPPEPELRYSPEWYQWAESVDYWNKGRQAAQ